MNADEQTIVDYIALLRSRPEAIQPEATRAMLEAADKLCPDHGAGVAPGVDETSTLFDCLEAHRSPARHLGVAAVMFGLGMGFVAIAKLALMLAAT